jgi:hypothetical protein
MSRGETLKGAATCLSARSDAPAARLFRARLSEAKPKETIMLHQTTPSAGVTIPLPRMLPAAARHKVEAAIEQHLQAVEALTRFLDEADGEPDIERDIVDEPHDDDEREVDIVDEPHDPNSDEENSLGWSGDVDQQRAVNNCIGIIVEKGGKWVERGWDLEAEHDGREPSLGATEPTTWSNDLLRYSGGTDDREEQCEDEGAQCEDEGSAERIQD